MHTYNSRNEFYKHPFGAVAKGSEITFRVSLNSRDFSPFLVIFKEYEEKTKLQMHFEKETDGKFIFTVCFVPPKEGLYFYSFEFWGNTLGIFNTGKGIGEILPHGNDFQLTVFKQNFYTPQNAKGNIFYQIFPDRFFEFSKKEKLSFEDRIYRQNKDGEPYFYPMEQKDGYLTKDYYGGDLKGICEKLPYLATLNVGYIYLNPIFEAHSNHRYNIADFMKIDPDLGTLEDFKQLCKSAHSLGIHIVLDGVFSHTGSDSIYFNKEGRYSTLGAWQSKDSPYRSWYDFDSKYASGYRAWWGFDTLPEVNENDHNYISYICGKNGVIDYWLSNGADGFRLDVADELPDDFIKLIRKAIKSHGDDKILIGEVWEDASNKISFDKRREFLLGEELDSCMNYPFRTATLNFLRDGEGDVFSENIMSICENYPKQALDVMMNSLSTHDTPRAMTAISADNPDGTDRFLQSKNYLTVPQYENSQKLIVCGFALLFTLPGVPCIYYGDEIGMQGYRDPFNRGYFKWWAVDDYILQNVKSISNFRTAHPVFKEGKIHFIYASDDCVAFLRYGENHKTVLVAVNRNRRSTTFYYNEKEYFVDAKNYLLLEL